VIEAILKIVREDPRYSLEAYDFVRRALAFAQDEMMMADELAGDDPDDEDLDPDEEMERHLTGQQLCEAIRRFALEQFGYLAQVVLKNWGVTSTGDFGEIVYNMIRAGQMRKSPSDRREHFDDVYDFAEAFTKNFRIQPPSA
jgi:uncharacterized repeat protein (TIGR04138 family)